MEVWCATQKVELHHCPARKIKAADARVKVHSQMAARHGAHRHRLATPADSNAAPPQLPSESTRWQRSAERVDTTAACVAAIPLFVFLEYLLKPVA